MLLNLKNIINFVLLAAVTFSIEKVQIVRFLGRMTKSITELAPLITSFDALISICYYPVYTMHGRVV